MNINMPNEIPEEAWEVFLPEDEELFPEEGDFWFDFLDMENE